jgi:hypothetical protein
MADDETPATQITVGALMALLQKADLPDDAVVMIDVGSDGAGTVLAGLEIEEWPDEIPAVDVSAIVGHGRPSKLIITMG